MEFVVGHHRVLKGPKYCDIFVPGDCAKRFSDECLAKSKVLQDEILKLMTETVSRPIDVVKEQVSKRCVALASFMENLMDEVNRSYLKLDLPQELELTPSERDSVMLGEISPHHDYYDSKSSSETPPSYNQLNYNENLQRFFNSRPTTIGAADNEMKMEANDNEVEPSITELSPLQRFDGSGDSYSGGNGSSESNNQMEILTNASNTETGVSSDSFQPPTLTEALLIRHNDDMEKSMIKKHKDSRNINRKRCGPSVWEVEANKHSKHQRLPDVRSKISFLNKDLSKESRPDADEQQIKQTRNQNIELWKPFSLHVTNVSAASPAPINTLAQSTRGIYPAVYFMQPTEAGGMSSRENSSVCVTPYYVTELVYANHPLYNQPVLYPPSLQQPQFTPVSSSPVGLPEQLVTNTTSSTTVSSCSVDKMVFKTKYSFR